MRNWLIKGFSLLELLVVISIIGLLSSVILASLNTARDNARDSVIDQGLLELSKQIVFESSIVGGLSESGSSIGWVDSTTDCDSITGYVYTEKYQQICRSLIDQIVDSSDDSNHFFMAQTEDDEMLIAARLSDDTYICRKGLNRRITFQSMDDGWPDECDPTGTEYANDSNGGNEGEGTVVVGPGNGCILGLEVPTSIEPNENFDLVPSLGDCGDVRRVKYFYGADIRSTYSSEATYDPWSIEVYTTQNGPHQVTIRVTRSGENNVLATFNFET